ncbi:MAG TPA: phenylalanine--tRNA ligase subunit beta [Polyangiaceae bacterium]|nr:phenylalanine--tRNA ligase subunit beta [Polyangiaceae bacterium]
MRASYRWLKELLPGLTASPDEVARRFGAAGLAVDGVRAFGAGLEAILVVRVLAKEPHPKRASLNLVTVDRGGVEQRVVCGASNVPAPGGLVVLAPLGATLPGMDGPLTPREIGGVLSEGMLCSETELGLAESAEGILILPEGAAAPGARFVDAFPAAQDTIYELDVTPNRPDALGHVGLARELAALIGLPFTPPAAGTPARNATESLDALIAIENRDTERCPHYAAGAVLDVTIAPSPLWLQWRLHSLGVRPISNVVDITNLLLLEFGQPLHAFDLDHVRGGKVIVRRATAGEPFATLDGVARKLDADDLVIADAEGPSALAGVMGGQVSEIRDTTRRVLVESAYFVPRGVRRTARRYGLHTEASHRFERGVDYAQVAHVLERAKTLLSELASGAVVAGAIHARGAEPELPEIRLRSARLDALLGVSVPFTEARAIIERLGFPVLEVSGSGADAVLRTRAVSFRPDVTREVDLIEEVCRVRGLDAIPTRLPAVIPQPPRATGKLEREVGAAAVSLGLSEAVTYAFVSDADLEKVHAPKPSVRLSNPLSEERNVMRTSLLPGLLEALRRARRRGETRARLFTLGSCFGALVSETASGTRPRLEADIGNLPREELRFAAVLAGTRHEYLSLKPEEVDVYDAKGLALELVERVTGKQATVRLATSKPPHLHPRGASEIWVGEVLIGQLGPLHPDVVDALDLGHTAQVVELDLEAVQHLGHGVPQFRAIPRLPAVTRDLSLVVADAVGAGKVGEILEQAGGALCESIELLGLFRGGSLPDGQKSLTFRVTCRDPKARSLAEEARTLTDKEVDEVQARMLKAAQTEFGATLRG